MERRRWRSDVSRGSPYNPGSATWPLPLGKTASQVVRWLLYRVCDRKEIIRALAYHRPIADVEAEDLDFGDSRRADEALAFAVDGNIDAEALESDDERAVHPVNTETPDAVEGGRSTEPLEITEDG